MSSTWAFAGGLRGGDLPALILAHGAGSDMNHPFMSFVHEALAQRGIITVKFNFAYREAGRKVPDSPQRLARTWRAVIQRVRAETNPRALFLGGKSMGGRIATVLAAEGEPASGLVLLGYPLHPSGRPDALRTAHLGSIRCPMLFVQGTRDRLCDPDLLQAALARVSAPWALHWVDNGDHSFKVPRRPEQQVWNEIVEAVGSWLTGHVGLHSAT